jgi:acyl carrier protein
MTTFSASEFFPVVRKALADAVLMDEGEIVLESHIYLDLGLGSIDLLDVLFRVEKALGVKISFRNLDLEFSGRIAGSPEDMWTDDKWGAYTAWVQSSFRQPLATLGWPADFAARVERMTQSAEEHGVAPFSVAFMCICIKRLANDADA